MILAFEANSALSCQNFHILAHCEKIRSAIITNVQKQSAINNVCKYECEWMHSYIRGKNQCFIFSSLLRPHSVLGHSVRKKNFKKNFEENSAASMSCIFSLGIKTKYTLYMSRKEREREIAFGYSSTFWTFLLNGIALPWWQEVYIGQRSAHSLFKKS